MIVPNDMRHANCRCDAAGPISTERLAIQGALAAFRHVVETGGHLDVPTARILVRLFGEVFPEPPTPSRSDLLDRLADATRLMRTLQIQYFKTRARETLTLAKGTEKRVDALLIELAPGRQKKLFT